MDVSLIQSHLKNYGFWATVYDIGYRGVNRLLLYESLRGMWISFPNLNKKYLEASPQYVARFLSQQEIVNLARAPESHVSDQFVEIALAKGDECYAIFDGQHLASFGWYSQKPTLLQPRLTLHFAPSYVYMYNGYTFPEYRGQRLHAVGMSRALKEYSNRGRKGLVSVVQSNNLESLRSCYRMGYKDFGDLRVVGLFDKLWTFHSRGCQAFNFFLEVAPQ